MRHASCGRCWSRLAPARGHRLRWLRLGLQPGLNRGWRVREPDLAGGRRLQECLQHQPCLQECAHYQPWLPTPKRLRRQLRWQLLSWCPLAQDASRGWHDPRPGPARGYQLHRSWMLLAQGLGLLLGPDRGWRGWASGLADGRRPRELAWRWPQPPMLAPGLRSCPRPARVRLVAALGLHRTRPYSLGSLGLLPKHAPCPGRALPHPVHPVLGRRCCGSVRAPLPRLALGSGWSWLRSARPSLGLGLKRQCRAVVRAPSPKAVPHQGPHPHRHPGSSATPAPDSPPHRHAGADRRRQCPALWSPVGRAWSGRCRRSQAAAYRPAC